jgi:hypothetical protein
VSLLWTAAQPRRPYLPKEEWVSELSGDPEAESWESGVLLNTENALKALDEGDLEIEGRLTDASNLTLYCTLHWDGATDGTLNAVYKPIRGERPLDDFPRHTLAYREAAAWQVSRLTGWRIVPPTIIRDGPAGNGMVQLWMEVDQEADVLSMILTRDPRLRQVALLDAILNNADRKGGHILPTETGAIHGCDHGVCFAVEPKLRTVLWGWRGEPLDEDEMRTLERVRDGMDGALGTSLRGLLAPIEVDETCRRIDTLLREKTMPVPDPYRHVIPWPPF